MKKTIKLLQLIFSFSFILLFANCRNSTGGIEERTVIFKGNFSIDQSLISSGGSFEEETSRSAQPELPTITYYAKAINSNDSTDVINSEDIDADTGTFSIPLKTGKTWIIEVGARGTSAVSGTSAVLIKDSTEEPFDPATASTPVVNETFYLKPKITENGEGKLNLTIKIENPYGNKIKKVGIKPQKNLTYSGNDAVIAGWKDIPGWDSDSASWICTSGLDVISTKEIQIQKNNFPSGIWEVAINFMDDGGQLLFASTQIISVYDDLETKNWESSKTNASSNELIKDGVFLLTTQLVDSYGLTEFYVGGTGASDDNNGSPNKPFATIGKAVRIINSINRKDQTYTIHVIHGIEEIVRDDQGNDAQLLIQANISIECYETYYGDRKGTATIISNFSAAAIKIERSEVSSSALTIEGIKSGNSWTGLKIKKGSYRTTSASTRGIEISTDCSLYMNGGEISENIISGSSSLGAGVYVGENAYFSMTGGIIKNNQASGNGGAIYISSTGELSMKGGKIINNKAGSEGGAIYNSGTMTVSGPVTIFNNTNTASPAAASNVYLTTGKVIKINGELADTTIGIKTQTPPRIGEPVCFTEGYAFGKEWGKNNDKHPHLIFASDVAGYSIMTDPTPDDPTTEDIDENTGDAFLGISGGTITQKPIPQLYFELIREQGNDESGDPGKMAYRISVQEANVFSGTRTMTASLKYLGAPVPASLWEFTVTGINNKLLINANLPAGVYTVEVYLQYTNDDFPIGIAYAASLALTKL